MSDNTIRVGVGVFVRHQGKFLILFRVKPHGQGTWGLPGGHLEFGETPEQCALRETLEETGLQTHSPRIIGVTNDIFPETGKHYITVFVETQSDSAAFTVTEPEKYINLSWITEDELPSPLFLPLANYFKQAQESRPHAA
ncbi:MAG: NUDIX domain-containing protein [Alphaproteobacteria bacterium]|nr:MAG: NUDIX domain-containing protein [Alphaproteobacteria bacterium]